MLSKSLGSPMKRNLLGYVMRYETNKEKNTKLGEGLRGFCKGEQWHTKKEDVHPSIQFVGR